MKKIAFIVSIIGLVLLNFGAYVLFIKPFKEIPSITNYTGKYTNSNGTIYIYQNDTNEGYFVINNEIYGKANIDKNMSSLVNGVNYEFILDNNILNVKTSNSIVNGLYQKEKTLTLKEYYNEIYGDADLLETLYNGIYKDNEMEIIMYQFSVDEVKAFIKNNNQTQLFSFVINSTGQLNSLQNEDNYVISMHGDKLFYTFEGSTNFFQKELSFNKKITYKDVLELYINK